mgnify:CR=1 FL=1
MRRLQALLQGVQPSLDLVILTVKHGLSLGPSPSISTIFSPLTVGFVALVVEPYQCVGSVDFGKEYIFQTRGYRFKTSPWIRFAKHMY